MCLVYGLALLLPNSQWTKLDGNGEIDGQQTAIKQEESALFFGINFNCYRKKPQHFQGKRYYEVAWSFRSNFKQLYIIVKKK